MAIANATLTGPSVTQVDVAARFGMNSGSPDFGATAGLSVKF
jgi:hypothetical protein